MYLFVPSLYPVHKKLGTPHFQRAAANFFPVCTQFLSFSENRRASALFWANVRTPVFFMNEYVNIYIKLVTKTATPRAPAGLRSLLKLGTKVGTKVGTKWVHFPENWVQKTPHYLCNAVKDYT